MFLRRSCEDHFDLYKKLQVDDDHFLHIIFTTQFKNNHISQGETQTTTMKYLLHLLLSACLLSATLIIAAGVPPPHVSTGLVEPTSHEDEKQLNTSTTKVVTSGEVKTQSEAAFDEHIVSFIKQFFNNVIKTEESKSSEPVKTGKGRGKDRKDGKKDEHDGGSGKSSKPVKTGKGKGKDRKDGKKDEHDDGTDHKMDEYCYCKVARGPKSTCYMLTNMGDMSCESRDCDDKYECVSSSGTKGAIICMKKIVREKIVPDLRPGRDGFCIRRLIEEEVAMPYYGKFPRSFYVEKPV